MSEIDNLLNQLGAPLLKSVDGFTVQELKKENGRSEKWIRSKIARAMELGVIEKAGYKYKEDIDGEMSPRPAYRLVQKKGK